MENLGQGECKTRPGHKVIQHKYYKVCNLCFLAPFDHKKYFLKQKHWQVDQLLSVDPKMYRNSDMKTTTLKVGFF